MIKKINVEPNYEYGAYFRDLEDRQNGGEPLAPLYPGQQIRFFRPHCLKNTDDDIKDNYSEKCVEKEDPSAKPPVAKPPEGADRPAWQRGFMETTNSDGQQVMEREWNKRDWDRISKEAYEANVRGKDLR